MDIAKIRKKIKKLEEDAKQKDKAIEQDIKEPLPGTPPKETTAEAEIREAEAGEEVTEIPDTEILAFKLGNEEYAVRMTELQEIIRYQRITSVPCSPEYLIGVTSLRGKILPVIDLKLRLGLKGENAERQKIIILSGKKDPIGALVSSILGVYRFPASEILPPPSILTEKEKGFIEGVVKIKNKFIPILNVDEIIKLEAL
jgi:purine-binding chemotaxis protein CheW